MKGHASYVEGFYIRLHHIARNDPVLEERTVGGRHSDALRRASSGGRSGLSTRGVAANKKNFLPLQKELTEGSGASSGGIGSGSSSTGDNKKKSSSDMFFQSLPSDTPGSKLSILLPSSVYSSSGNSSVVTVLNAGPGASSYVLHGLYHYRAYTIFLVPFFSTMEGQPSNTRSFLTSEAGKILFLCVLETSLNIINYENKREGA